MLIGYFLAQWKVAKIILHLKPGKHPNEPMSYRPISLVPILSKVYEKFLLHRLLPIIENRRLLPDHQCGFCQRHEKLTVYYTRSTKHLKPGNTAPQPSWIPPKLSTTSGTLDSYTSYDNFSPTIITPISNHMCMTDISKSRLKIHTQTSSPLTQEYLKVVSLALYFISSTLLTYQPPQTLP
jgi:hypothetical protein